MIDAHHLRDTNDSLIQLLQIASVTTQVAISRRVSRFKLQLRDRQEARRSRSRGGGDGRPTPMAWGWSLDAA
ncbi:unnamed protein product [Laminaria digitata]